MESAFGLWAVEGDNQVIGRPGSDAGNKVTTISEVSDRQVYHPIVDALLLNPVLSLN